MGGRGGGCRFSAKSEIINPGNKSFVDPGPAVCFELTAGERDANETLRTLEGIKDPSNINAEDNLNSKISKHPGVSQIFPLPEETIS